MICITIAVTYVLVKRCFLIELIPSSSDERDAIQKKTFTKWVNKHLKKVTFDFYIIMLEFERVYFGPIRIYLHRRDIQYQTFLGNNDNRNRYIRISLLVLAHSLHGFGILKIRKKC